MKGAGESIKSELLKWEGVTAHEHQFGSVVFRLGAEEIGHLHGDAIADIHLPSKVIKKLLSQGRVSPHHVVPQSDWASYEIREEQDVGRVLELLRMQYDRLATKKKK